MWVIGSRPGPPCAGGVTWEDGRSAQADDGSSAWAPGRTDGRDLPGTGTPTLVGGGQAPAGRRDAGAGRDRARGRPTARRQRQPALRLAQALPAGDRPSGPGVEGAGLRRRRDRAAAGADRGRRDTRGADRDRAAGWRTGADLGAGRSGGGRGGAAGAGRAMIPFPGGARGWGATGPTDMRKGKNGLALQVQEVLKSDPYSGHLFV